MFPVTLTELCKKDVIQVSSGANLGRVDDLEFDGTGAMIRQLVLFGRPRLFGLLGRQPDVMIPWQDVQSIGQDVVLVRTELPPPSPRAREGLLRELFGQP